MKQRYSENEDYLLALVAHLGLTSWKSRTTEAIARDLGLDHDKVKATLAGFPGLFRVARNSSDSGHDFYTLQIRYALRPPKGRSNEDVEDADDKLDRGQVIELMKFVADKAAVEREAAGLSEQVEQMREASQATIATEMQKREAAQAVAARTLDVEVKKMEEGRRASRALLEQGDKKISQARNASYLAFGSALLAAVVAFIAAILKSNGG